ncbi:TIGR02996 domain-containing protein [Frigoriglobus tundricola]|uniref:TIGR02996 domain-containing protein n=1 Tax=Frigoriglobus tundricola TaxID=2774151 RepID=A0A6M5YPL1_9BACT|nr:TIGR02996 domain-containing protein [Frigoriglobus tundricola]QJW95286.1 hypothetical protein FTUN_2828 [Frigoriglobus tundricola]
MNEREALLRAVCDTPDDDTPRLVFADWLQENGDEARAEFIRVQIELSRAQEMCPRVSNLMVRQHKLLRLNEQRWRAELPSDAGFRRNFHFERGFVESLTVYDFTESRRVVVDTFAATPLIHLDCIRVRDLGELAELAELSRIRYLGFWVYNPTPESVTRFVSTTNLAALEQVAIRGPTIDFALEDLLAERFGSKLLRNT